MGITTRGKAEDVYCAVVGVIAWMLARKQTQDIRLSSPSNEMKEDFRFMKPFSLDLANTYFSHVRNVHKTLKCVSKDATYKVLSQPMP